MREYYFGDRLKGSTTARRFSSYHEALNFVRRESSNPAALAEIRAWAHRRGAMARTDRQLFEFAAQCLVSGQLAAKTRNRIKTDRAARADLYVPSSTQSATFLPKSEPELRVRGKEPPKPALSAAPAMNVDQQIAALKAAAKSGAPFCEQCERKRLAKAQ